MCLYFLHVTRDPKNLFISLSIIKMNEKILNQNEQFNKTVNKNSEWLEDTLTQEILSSTKEKLEEVIETKNIENLYYVRLDRWNPNHGPIWYIDIVAATYATAFPEKYEWDYDYDVRLSIKVENVGSNKVRLSCEGKDIVVDLGYNVWKPETIDEKCINKILNILWYEIKR